MPVPTPEEIDKKNRQTINYFMPFWLNSYRMNCEYINRAMRKQQFAHKLPFNNKELKGVVIIASGPSLRDMAPYLKELNDYLVICGATNYAFCRAHGLIPDIIAIADSNPMQIRDIFSVLDHHPNTNIICSPNVHPTLFSIWPEEKVYWTKTYIQSKDGSMKNPFNDFQNMLFRNVPDHILQAGNVTNMSLILLELFRKSKRYEEIPKTFLLGYDLACIPETFRVPKYFQEHDGTFKFYPQPEVVNDLDSRYLIKHEDQITTTQMHGYRRSMLMLWQTVPWQVWRCSEKGLLKEVPYHPIEKLAKGELPKKLPDSYRKKAWKAYQDIPEPVNMDGTPLDNEPKGLISNADITVAGSELNPTGSGDK